MKKQIIRILGKKASFYIFGITAPTKETKVNFAMNGELLKHMVSQLNNNPKKFKND